MSDLDPRVAHTAIRPHRSDREIRRLQAWQSKKTKTKKKAYAAYSRWLSLSASTDVKDSVKNKKDTCRRNQELQW